jgi:hypothetical protein
MMKEPKSPDQALSDLGDLFKQRNALYGDNYKRFGPALMSLMPSGVFIQDAHDMNRFAIFVMMFVKISRYAQNFSQNGHPDSLDDLSVYAQMLRELDATDPRQANLFDQKG